MADDEQFSLCWNNFNSNLSAGFHESLCRGDLVDVTLAAEGHLVKAHRLVLSVCSPYFRKMFTDMPAGGNTVVFLKDVSHSALKDLIQFMYCGEVNVKQEALPAFISTAEALQIKGLTDSDPPASQNTPEQAAPAPPQPIQQMTPRAQRPQRSAAATRSYKIESIDDNIDDAKPMGQTQIVIQTTTAAPQQQQNQATTIIHNHPQHIQSQQQHLVSNVASTSSAAQTSAPNKRTAHRSSAAVQHTKRAKSTIDPLDTTETATTATTTQIHPPQHITVQTAVVTTEPKIQQARQQTQQQATPSETEYLELPAIEIPTKSEPDYAEEPEVVTGEQDTSYVEEDAYGDLRYDDSYFTENDDVAAAPSGTGNANTSGSTTATTSKAVKQQASQSFSDSSFVDAAEQGGNTDAQAVEGCVAEYAATSRGRVQLIYGGQPFIFEKNLKLSTGEEKKYWRCNQWWNQKCRSRVFTINDIVMPLNRFHTHEDIVKRKKRTRRTPAVPASSTNAANASALPSTSAVTTSSTTPELMEPEIKISKYEISGAPTLTRGASTIDVSELGMHLKYEEIVANVTELCESSVITIGGKQKK